MKKDVGRDRVANGRLVFRQSERIERDLARVHITAGVGLQREVPGSTVVPTALSGLLSSRLPRISIRITLSRRMKWRVIIATPLSADWHYGTNPSGPAAPSGLEPERRASGIVVVGLGWPSE